MAKILVVLWKPPSKSVQWKQRSRATEWTPSDPSNLPMRFANYKHCKVSEVCLGLVTRLEAPSSSRIPSQHRTIDHQPIHAFSTSRKQPPEMMTFLGTEPEATWAAELLKLPSKRRGWSLVNKFNPGNWKVLLYTFMVSKHLENIPLPCLIAGR